MAALVLEVAPWQFTPEGQADELRGISVAFLDSESPLIGRKRGFETLRISGSEDLASSLHTVPGWYDLTFRLRASRKTGKAEMQLTAAEFVMDLALPKPGMQLLQAPRHDEFDDSHALG